MSKENEDGMIGEVGVVIATAGTLAVGIVVKTTSYVGETSVGLLDTVVTKSVAITKCTADAVKSVVKTVFS